jgi:hypothetical protein
MNLLFKIIDSIPDPWNWKFLALTVAVSVIATISACMRTASNALPFGLAALALTVLAVFLGRRLVLASSSLANNRVARLVIAPLLLGIPPMLTAVVMRDPGAGGYPAALSVLLGFVLMITRDTENRARAAAPGNEDYPVHTVFHQTLAAVSTVFFFFGVTTLWPWLGHIYGNGYFWILVIGFLMPTLYLWGRLRQPRHHSSMVALVRFNRTLPYLGLVLLVAILVG